MKDEVRRKASDKSAKFHIHNAWMPNDSDAQPCSSRLAQFQGTTTNALEQQSGLTGYVQGKSPSPA